MIEQIVSALRDHGVAIAEATQPPNRRVLIIREVDGTVTELPVVDLGTDPADYVLAYDRTRGTTLAQREAQWIPRPESTW